MKLLYAANAPFVIVYFLFTLAFCVAAWRGEKKP